MEREDHLFEELCKKGKAYRAKRMAAGEKSSAYLSGRAVKVCKGQMQGEGEEIDEVESEDDTEFTVSLKHLLKKHVTKGGKVDEVYEEIDALHENEEYCPKCATKIKEIIREEIIKEVSSWDGAASKQPGMWDGKPSEKGQPFPAVGEAKTKPAKGKRFAKKVKNPKTGRTRTVSYGQAGKAKKGGDRIRPGTAKGNAYCARSAKIKKCKNPPCANALSRKKWKCQGSRSVK